MDENPSCFLDYERPVENITWKDTQNFCRRLNQLHSTADFFRLPTEAEWERACRAGTQNTIYDGDIENDKPETRIALGRVAWYAENSGDAYDLEKSIDRIVRNAQNQPCLEKQGTRKVGKKIPNEWGLYDMLGNVWEWCSDAFGYFSYQRDGADTQAERLEYVMDPTGPKGARTRVIRGGAWNEPAHNVRAACRDDEHPNTRDVNIGFRLVGSSGAPPYEEDTNSEFRK
jgi:formylglycine-generating enzyme required for sulfatase activity